MTINTRCNLLSIDKGAFIVVIAYEMVKRGFDRGHAQGVEEGPKKAYADADRQIAAYYKRMQEAKERGEEFNEPPPRFTDQQGQDDINTLCNLFKHRQRRFHRGHRIRNGQEGL